MLDNYLSGGVKNMKLIKKETFKDILAIFIAVIQVVWPFILISIGVYLLLTLFLTKIWL
ncbi:hypothetical protein Ccel_1763 [Ruminiclostridium cellulolyticum H10]|uniref:Uncharacterized protein n=1 Tax=Ruminiclostridium cellulolyticum (strain ATCC 35319 / DSM 5812 / JCM 6584 / H10) TaxID=394503 RepID=B8I2X1_RUMCH|nr:hypothetical protein Ccel_1763 [Ruminiclostridium cellulolyticum H10]